MASLDPRPLVIPPVQYQSNNITFSDWITLLTLCLAPLVAHIIAGTPSPSYLCEHRPRWHDQICHYNPTSILWRYAAIADRRIRATSWNARDLAATNAVFWTERGWDGSEEMVEISFRHLVHEPDHSRVSIFSRDMITTLIVTFQGFQAITLLSVALCGGGGDTGFTVWMAVDIIFFPLALIGLLRLFCGIWLSEDFSYSIPPARNLGSSSSDQGRMSFDSILEAPLLGQPGRFRGTACWRSRVFRLVYALALLGLIALACLYLVSGGRYTATTFIVVLFYLLFLVVTLLIVLVYFYLGRTTTTIIPCITSFAYKLYTGVVFGFALAAVVVSCIETRKTPCGIYTSGIGTIADLRACLKSAPDVISVAENSGHSFYELVTFNSTAGSNGTVDDLDLGTQQAVNFTGMCLGKILGLE